jgi:serine/threonine protein kinase
VGPGDTIDHYRLERRLGAGAFATVWLAHDEYLDSRVAIKVLAENWARNDEIRRRFIDEAKIMRLLDHDRMVRVFTVGELPTGQPMFVMSLADRGTLADRIDDGRERRLRFPLDQVGALALELLAVLAVVHDFGIIHRDLKPSNILFRSARARGGTADGSARSVDDEVMILADFGLAKDLSVSSGFTLAGGTPAYMPPEQARISADVDHRADIFSATAVIFELLAGDRPFDSRSLQAVRDDRSSPGARLAELRPDLPSEWRTLVDTGMAELPDQRFPSARALADAIETALASGGIDADPTIISTRRPVAVAPDPIVRRGGVTARVAEIVNRFGEERPAAVDRHLTGHCVVGLIGSTDDHHELSAHTGSLGLDVHHLGANDVRLGDADVLVVGTGARFVLTESVTDVLAEAPAGPIVIADAEDPGLHDLLSTVTSRADVIKASAALATLDATVRRAGSTALSAAWVSVGDEVEQLRIDEPAIAELRVLRDDVAGRLMLPDHRRVQLRALLFETDLARRLMVEPSASPGRLIDRAADWMEEWREFAESGRVPFGSRHAVDITLQSLERLWVEQTSVSG